MPANRLSTAIWPVSAVQAMWRDNLADVTQQLKSKTCKVVKLYSPKLKVVEKGSRILGKTFASLRVIGIELTLQAAIELRYTYSSYIYLRVII